MTAPGSYRRKKGLGVVEDTFSGPTSTTGETLYDGDTAVGPEFDE
jgi:hypothetical protein